MCILYIHTNVYKYYLVLICKHHQWLIGDTDSNDQKKTRGDKDNAYFRHLQVTREAAHNLVTIYKLSGAKDQALEIMQKYLVF
jgi:hypothetical protein